MSGGKKWLAAACALGVLVAAPVMQGWYNGGTNNYGARRLQYYNAFWKADSIDAGIRYFATAGSLTANADSAEYVTFGDFINQGSGSLNLRVYHDKGNLAPGTDSSYTLVALLSNSGAGNNTGNEWSIPPGMRVKGIRVASWSVSSYCIIRVGR